MWCESECVCVCVCVRHIDIQKYSFGQVWTRENGRWMEIDFRNYSWAIKAAVYIVSVRKQKMKRKREKTPLLFPIGWQSNVNKGNIRRTIVAFTQTLRDEADVTIELQGFQFVLCEKSLGMKSGTGAEK